MRFGGGVDNRTELRIVVDWGCKLGIRVQCSRAGMCWHNQAPTEDGIEGLRTSLGYAGWKKLVELEVPQGN